MTDAFDGVLVVDKPAGMTSHDVVATVRRRLPRGTKVGHTGTLDPFATGVLPIVIGKATRLAQFLASDRKRYLAEIAFGTATDSGDCTGAVVATATDAERSDLDADRVAAALAGFLGTHPQVPPAHSAKKIDGERAYVLARQGAVVELEAVEVTAHALTLVRWQADTAVASVDLESSAGYYVRSLARDLGRRLGVPAHLAALRRTASGRFRITTACPLASVIDGGTAAIGAARLPMSALLPHLPAIALDERQLGAVRRGQPLALPSATLSGLAADRVRFLDTEGRLVALARPVGSSPDLWRADIVLG